MFPQSDVAPRLLQHLRIFAVNCKHLNGRSYFVTTEAFTLKPSGREAAVVESDLTSVSSEVSLFLFWVQNFSVGASARVPALRCLFVCLFVDVSVTRYRVRTATTRTTT